eukprot:TRINITY_DN4670_c0_g2_i1.p1 TRINITY_DN4670_c0_g2~~TRINITY_DN4670_c0_g2_i1.p1  ORF type:complete len:227 (-),score=42.72 TRINITY_DN4670_c0_g2_i1:40-720(-)
MEEEKKMELEALGAIYMEDLNIKGENEIEITLVPIPGGTNEENRVAINLEITYTKDYPNEVPIIRVRGKRGVNSTIEKELQEKVTKQAEESLGMAMVFTLAQTIKDWLDENNQEEEEVEEEKEAEPEVFVGTPVTIDTYNSWIISYKLELAEKAKMSSADKDQFPGKYTGRQLFEIITTLIYSDEPLEGGEKAIEVIIAFTRAIKVTWDLFKGENLKKIDIPDKEF